LLTNNFQVTTVLYYILFLPGILLHEVTLWLAASILNLRAERAIGFPEQQEIGELRLNFIRVSPGSGPIRHTLTKLAPIGSGLACLWLIASQIFNWQDAAAIAASGSIDDLAEAIYRLTRTADFWLWFYLAFTVANTMFPALGKKVSARQKSALAIVIGALISVVWWFGGEVEVLIAQGMESLAISLALVLLQIIFINIAVVLILGALEAAIERVTGKSATFADGKMITMSRGEAGARKTMQGRERRASSQEPQTSETVEAITSVYDLKLPTPGPPGREPVSRNAVAVVNLRQGESDISPRGEPTPKPTSLPKQPIVELERSSPNRHAPAVLSSESPAPAVKPSQSTEVRKKARPGAKPNESTDGQNAPFSRPFVNAASGGYDDHNSDDAGAYPVEGSFPRPFAMKTRGDSEPDISDMSPADPRGDKPHDADVKHRASQSRTYVNRTRPAPKPSNRLLRGADKSTRLRDDELTYEPFDDEGVYANDDDD